MVPMSDVGMKELVPGSGQRWSSTSTWIQNNWKVSTARRSHHKSLNSLISTSFCCPWKTISARRHSRKKKWAEKFHSSNSNMLPLFKPEPPSRYTFPFESKSRIQITTVLVQSEIVCWHKQNLTRFLSSSGTGETIAEITTVNIWSFAENPSTLLECSVLVLFSRFEETLKVRWEGKEDLKKGLGFRV